ncbi:hypothetical protein [Bacillus anthracis]|uniref:hypothetical protein n=1 Tax=Bacillus anthracis TaxID=1392 RepID=UPI0001DBF613|nr:hypothetical protein [Bacillus cereus]ADK08369.1 hypothetical protein BACI_pBAslCI1400180 [Bacillus cereus biovar anthracis str. CI]
MTEKKSKAVTFFENRMRDYGVETMIEAKQIYNMMIAITKVAENKELSEEQIKEWTDSAIKRGIEKRNKDR